MAASLSHSPVPLTQVVAKIFEDQMINVPNPDFFEDSFDMDMTPWTSVYDQEDQRESQEQDQSAYNFTIKSLLAQEKRLNEKCYRYRQRFIRNWKLIKGIKTTNEFFEHQNEIPPIISADTIKLTEIRNVLENMVPEWQGRTW